MPDGVETVNTKDAYLKSELVDPKEISIVQDGEVTGKTNTSSRRGNIGTESIVKDPNEGGFNVDRSNSLY